jgi:hypothetical protein
VTENADGQDREQHWWDREGETSEEQFLELSLSYKVT